MGTKNMFMSVEIDKQWHLMFVYHIFDRSVPILNLLCCFVCFSPLSINVAFYLYLLFNIGISIIYRLNVKRKRDSICFVSFTFILNIKFNAFIFGATCKHTHPTHFLECHSKYIVLYIKAMEMVGNNWDVYHCEVIHTIHSNGLENLFFSHLSIINIYKKNSFTQNESHSIHIIFKWEF